MNGDTPDIGKWGAYKSYARAYNLIAQKYIVISGDQTINTYKLGLCVRRRIQYGLIQKEVFDMVYADTLILSVTLSAFDTGEAASISAIQDMLTAHLRQVIFTRPEKESDVQNAIETLLIGRGYQNLLITIGKQER